LALCRSSTLYLRRRHRLGGVLTQCQYRTRFAGGHLAGPSASATAGVGVGTNVLTGGSNKTISLQPVSIEGNTGLNVAAGIAGSHVATGPVTTL